MKSMLIFANESFNNIRFVFVLGCFIFGNSVTKDEYILADFVCGGRKSCREFFKKYQFSENAAFYKNFSGKMIWMCTRGQDGDEKLTAMIKSILVKMDKHQDSPDTDECVKTFAASDCIEKYKFVEKYLHNLSPEYLREIEDYKNMYFSGLVKDEKNAKINIDEVDDDNNRGSGFFNICCGLFS